MTKGKDIVELALEHVGEAYVLGIQVPKHDPNWRGPWDCAEFCSWLLFQTAQIPYGWIDNQVHPALGDAYTGAWARDARRLGIKVSVAEAAGTAGAFVLRYNGKRGHIVVSDGQGGTVEAMNARKGVTRSRIAGRRWDMGILVPGIDYAGAAIKVGEGPPKTYRLTRPYMRAPAVKEIQRCLYGFCINPGEIDGVYGPRTEAAVRKFQAVFGLVVDGEVGSKTCAALGLLGLVC